MGGWTNSETRAIATAHAPNGNSLESIAKTRLRGAAPGAMVSPRFDLKFRRNRSTNAGSMTAHFVWYSTPPFRVLAASPLAFRFVSFAP
jgi:hypothetical protein